MPLRLTLYHRQAHSSNGHLKVHYLNSHPLPTPPFLFTLTPPNVREANFDQKGASIRFLLFLECDHLLSRWIIGPLASFLGSPNCGWCRGNLGGSGRKEFILLSPHQRKKLSACDSVPRCVYVFVLCLPFHKFFFIFATCLSHSVPSSLYLRKQCTTPCTSVVQWHANAIVCINNY